MYKNTYYQILNVKETASQYEIKEAYHLMMKMLHPDRFDRIKQKEEWLKANEMVKSINEAYDTLKDPEKRKRYDAEIRIEQGKSQEVINHEERSDSGKKVEKIKDDVKSGNVYLNELPEQTKQKILALFNNNIPESIVFWKREISFYISILVFCLIVSIVSIFLALDYKWSENKLLIISLANISSFIVVYFQIVFINKWRKSAIKPRAMFTPMYIIKSGFDKISFRWLWDMDDFKVTNHFKKSGYFGGEKFEKTTISIKYGKEWVIEEITKETLAEEIIESLRKWEILIKNLIRNNDIKTLIKYDTFYGVKNYMLKNHSQKLFSFKTASVLAAIYVIFILSLIQLNLYYDDYKSWNTAKEKNKASSYRLYITTHPKGRWVENAKYSVLLLYDKAVNSYKNRLSPHCENKAVNAIIGIIKEAKGSDNYRVGVYFKGNNKIPADIHAQLERMKGYGVILEVGDAFSISKMQARHTKLLSEVKQALERTIPNDIIELELTQDEGNAKIIIDYSISCSYKLYYRESDESVPHYLRPYYPGILISWVCYIKPISEEGYKFSLRSKPAERFTDRQRGVYEDMTDSAFDDFRMSLIKKIGV